MDSVLFDFGIFQIRWYSFFIMIAFIIASVFIIKESKKKNIPEEYLSNLIFYGLIIGILGARIYYVLFNLDYYLEYPKEILMIWNGGLAIHGGIIATLIFLVIYSKKKEISSLLMTDIIVVGLIIAQAIGRWGNFFNGEAYGRIVSKSFLDNLHLPDFIINGMFIDGFYREPTFLYESLLSLLGFIIIILIRKYIKTKVGQITGIYLIWYGIERFIIETFRSDSLMLGPLKMAQCISLIAIIVGIYLIIKKMKDKEIYQKVKLKHN